MYPLLSGPGANHALSDLCFMVICNLLFDKLFNAKPLQLLPVWPYLLYKAFNVILTCSIKVDVDITDYHGTMVRTNWYVVRTRVQNTPRGSQCTCVPFSNQKVVT